MGGQDSNLSGEGVYRLEQVALGVQGEAGSGSMEGITRARNWSQALPLESTDGPKLRGRASKLGGTSPASIPGSLTP